MGHLNCSSESPAGINDKHENYAVDCINKASSPTKWRGQRNTISMILQNILVLEQSAITLPLLGMRQIKFWPLCGFLDSSSIAKATYSLRLQIDGYGLSCRFGRRGNRSVTKSSIGSVDWLVWPDVFLQKGMLCRESGIELICSTSWWK